ncbi:hypothetical protein pb186bvf_018149 [Paramecium bursaria]
MQAIQELSCFPSQKKFSLSLNFSQAACSNFNISSESNNHIAIKVKLLDDDSSHFCLIFEFQKSFAS